MVPDKPSHCQICLSPCKCCLISMGSPAAACWSYTFILPTHPNSLMPYNYCTPVAGYTFCWVSLRPCDCHRPEEQLCQTGAPPGRRAQWTDASWLPAPCSHSASSTPSPELAALPAYQCVRLRHFLSLPVAQPTEGGHNSCARHTGIQASRHWPHCV